MNKRKKKKRKKKRKRKKQKTKNKKKKRKRTKQPQKEGGGDGLNRKGGHEGWGEGRKKGKKKMRWGGATKYRTAKYMVDIPDCVCRCMHTAAKLFCTPVKSVLIYLS